MLPIERKNVGFLADIGDGTGVPPTYGQPPAERFRRKGPHRALLWGERVDFVDLTGAPDREDVSGRHWSASS